MLNVPFSPEHTFHGSKLVKVPRGLQVRGQVIHYAVKYYVLPQINKKDLNIVCVWALTGTVLCVRGLGPR